MTFGEFVKFAANGVKSANEYDDNRRLMVLDRDDAMAAMEAKMAAMTQRQVADFEFRFLQAGILVINPLQRVRATELYGFIKMYQVERFGISQAGFKTAADALG